MLLPILASASESMTAYDDSIEIVRRSGHRLTPQRLLLLNTITESQHHIGVDEIFKIARSNYPYLDLATVYRTLHLFRDIGVVTEIGIGDRHTYEIRTPDSQHHHMLCRICSKTFSLSTHYLAAFRKSLVKDFNFEPDLDNFAVAGICSHCKSNSS